MNIDLNDKLDRYVANAPVLPSQPSRLNGDEIRALVQRAIEWGWMSRPVDRSRTINVIQGFPTDRDMAVPSQPDSQ